MSPRAVSRSLQEGLTSLGKTPATVNVEDVEQILKGQVFRLLQATMPAVAAKETIHKLLTKLETLRQSAPSPAVDLRGQGRALDELQDALKPFNLYFEWPETQKLRTQIGLLKTDHEAGRAAGKLVEDARAQLETLRQKLEDHLVAQARELSDLEAGLDVVKTLGGSKVRRLESLTGQIRRAQDARELASAEVERARKLVTDLRKLMESSVVRDPAPSQATDAGLLGVEDERGLLTSFDMPTATPGPRAAPQKNTQSEKNAGEERPKDGSVDALGERLRRIDAEDALRKLESLTRSFSHLLAHESAWAEKITQLRTLIESGGDETPDITQPDVAPPNIAQPNIAQPDILQEIAALSSQLPLSREALRKELTREFETLQASLGEGLQDEPELARALQIALGVLETALPSLADTQKVRGLAKAAQEHARELEAAQADFEARLQAQGEALRRFQNALERHAQVPAAATEHRALFEAVTRLAATQAQGRVDADLISAAQGAEAALEGKVAKTTQISPLERERSLVRALLSRLQVLPLLPALEAPVGKFKGELETLLRRDTIGREEVQKAQARAAGVEATLKAAYSDSLEALQARAAELEAPALTQRVEAERAAFAQPNADYPDLHALERALQAAFENLRATTLEDLHALETALRPYRALGEKSGDVDGLLEEARGKIEKGALTQALAPLRARLETLQGEVEARLGDFETRLDAALRAFEPVSRLNSDETATVKRTLRHLDTQRGAFYRVSLGVQLELEASLREAETLITDLQAQLEATRAVADFLVSDGLFGDILGLFDAPQVASPDHTHAPLQSLLEGYLHHPEVRSAAVISTGGELVSGHLEGSPDALHKALEDSEREAGSFGQGRHKDDAAPLVLEVGGNPVIAAWPTEGYRVVFVLRSLGGASSVTARLQGDMEAFGNILRGPTFA